jgi:uncharacterized lipoprotein YbaY
MPDMAYKKDARALRLLSVTVFAAWAAVAWNSALASSAVRDQTGKFTIKGSIAYDAGASLPQDSRAVVELRHLPALPDAPAVADQKIEIAGKQPPRSFEFSVERYKLVAGGAYIVRGVILSGKRAIWTSDDVKIDVSQSEVDVKEIALKPVK